jgi:hypothetical protein
MRPYLGYFLKQLGWIMISLLASLVLAFLLPFPINLIAILGVFIGLAAYRRIKMPRDSQLEESQGFMVSNGASTLVNYYCISCGVKHRESSCPECGSKMKKAGY